MPLLDANVFIRFLTNDNPDLSPRAARLFEALETGRRSVVVPDAVVVEVVFVLGSPNLYARSRDFIRDRLGHLLRMPAIEVPSKGICLDALDLYADNSQLSFLDAFCAAFARKVEDRTVITFDRGFRNIPGVVREEP